MLNDEIGLVVVNYNTENKTTKNIDAVIKNNEPFHIVIVDNASDNNEYEQLISYYSDNKYVDVLYAGGNAGYSRGNNIGIKKLLSYNQELRYICIMNPDAYCPCKDTFAHLISKLETEPNVVWIAPLLVENNCINTRQLGWNLPKYRDLIMHSDYTAIKLRFGVQTDIPYTPETNLLKYDAIQGSLFVIKADIFKKIHFFDEKVFMYSEENILAARLKKMNPDYCAAISLEDYYIHEHDFRRKNLDDKRKNTSMIMNAGHYYVRHYMHVRGIRYAYLLFSEWKYLNIELPIAEILHKIKYRMFRE